MPRSSDGSYSLPTGTIVSTGDTILVSQHNPPLTDLATAVGNSLDRDGKGGMRADLPMGGNKITNLADGVDDTDAVTVGQVASLGAIPIGAVLDYWGATPPAGYLFPVGQAVSRTTYAALFALIGTTAGAGDGSTTFNLPDYRGRVGAGKDDMGGTSAARLSTMSGTTLGSAGGSQTHTLTSAEIPAHTHPVTDPGHRHSTIGGSSEFVRSGVEVEVLQGDGIGFTNNATTGITVGANTGGGGAHNNIQPTIVCNKIIKVS